MGYGEMVCQLCGVSFAIGRIRTINEPHEAAWAYYGVGFVDLDGRYESPQEPCGKESGCQMVERTGLYGNPDDGIVGNEHVAGPGCIVKNGYNGNMISVEEMKGCRVVQCLAVKEPGWEPEPDDEDFEIESNCFLTGFGEGSPDQTTLKTSPVRHGISDLLISNIIYSGEDPAKWGFPFHPTCFEIFKRISRDRFGKVDIDGLMAWRPRDDASYDGYTEFFTKFPRSFAVKNGREQWWHHELGSEYLVANPIEIPGFKRLLQSCHRKFLWSGLGKVPYNVNQGVYSWRYKAPGDIWPNAYDVPPPTTAQSICDPFQKLPSELLSMVLDDLSSKDIANLRCVTRSCRQLPNILFRKRLMEDMPWFWEAKEMEMTETDWYKLYCMLKGCWQDMKGVKNRKRIWKDVNEIVDRIEKKLREEGRVVD